MGPGAPSLSPKHEAFCQAYIRLDDAKAAYLEVNPHVKPVCAKAAAGRLLKDPNVIARLAELREAIAESNKITVDKLIEELAFDRELARREGQPAAAVKATESIAKLAGLWVEKSETTHTMRPDEARALIGQLAGKYLPAPPPPPPARPKRKPAAAR